MARKKPISPKTPKLGKREISRLENKWDYLQQALGGQKALAGAIVNPKTGQPVNPRTLRKWWSGERALPQYAIDVINQSYADIKKAEKLQRRREKRNQTRQTVISQLFTYGFFEWFLALEQNFLREYEGVKAIDTSLENIRKDMEKTSPESVLIYGEIMPGWLSPVYGKHVIKQICKSDLILYGFRVFINGNYTRIYPIQHRPPYVMWNYERKSYSRLDDYPKILNLILEAWENLAADEYGLPVLVAFAQDPEQID